MNKLKRPTPKSIVAYDWNECAEYINALHNIDIENYADRSYDAANPRYNNEYQNFWHYIIDNKSIHNGTYFWLTEEDRESMTKEWQKEILDLFIQEFGNEIYFYVWW